MSNRESAEFIERPLKRCSGKLELRQLPLSSANSITHLPSTPESRTSLTLSSVDTTPALVTAHWLRGAILLTQAFSHHHLLLSSTNVSRRPSEGELYQEDVKQHPICVLDATWQAERGFDSYEQHYKQGHIPGATFLDLHALSPPQPEKHQGCPIPDPDHFQRYVTSLGVTSNTHVVTYDSLDTRPAARAWFLFRLFGHDRVSVLDGGLRQWRRDGYEVCTACTNADCPHCLSEDTSAQNLEPMFRVMFRPELLRNFREMKSIVENGTAQVIDCRPSNGGFYPHEGRSTAMATAGTSAGASPALCLPLSAPGHMPGAINIPFFSLFTAEGTFKPVAELLKLFQAAGVDFSAPLVASSQMGTASCSIALVAFLLGTHDLPVYNGSWAEWQALAPQSLIVTT